jgi:hypothetical protein
MKHNNTIKKWTDRDIITAIEKFRDSKIISSLDDILYQMEESLPYVSDDFQIGPDGAYEHNDSIVNRIEVINHIDGIGREYVKYFEGSLELSYQDNGKTLKIFLSKK